MKEKVLEYLVNLWYAIINKKSYNKDGDNMTQINEQLEKKANSILVNNDMLKLPVDLIKIADNYNIDVYYKELPEGVYGAIKYDNEEKKFKILLDKRESKDRIRFTLAHELAHYFLTQKQLMECNEVCINTLYRKDNNVEEDVDYLASALLMNKGIIQRAYSQIKSTSILAKIFEVPETILLVRLMNLGLI